MELTMFLRKVKNVYNFRKVTPASLREIVKVVELNLSLKTSDEFRAIKLAEALNLRVQNIEIDFKLGIIQREQVLVRFQEVGLLHSINASRKVEQTELDLYKLFVSFSKEKRDEGRWTKKTGMEYDSSFKLFSRYREEENVRDVTHQSLLRYRKLLKSLPPNFLRNKCYSGKRLSQIALMSPEKKLSPRQINKYLVCLTSFFKWLVVHEYIKKNPAHNLLLPKNTIASKERNAFSSEEIKKIYGCILYMKEELSNRPERFWVPLIGIYSGLRLSEICQLHIEDIKEEAGILSFFINDFGDKRIKNRASERLVPVHPKLKELGFLEYWQRVGEKSERLFPLLSNHPTNGYGHQLGKWFSKFNRKYITQDKKKTFHSLRHSVANELKQLQIPAEVISELLGHKLQSITINRYGKQYRPEVLLNAILRLPW